MFYTSLLFCALSLPSLPSSQVSNADDGLLLDVPTVNCEAGFEGEACLASVLRWHGNDVGPDYVFDHARVDPALGRAARAGELAAAAQHFGLKTGEVGYSIDDDQDLENLATQFVDDLKARTPTILRTGPRGQLRFVLVIGYDATTEEFVVIDPGNRSRKRSRFGKQALLDEARWRSDGNGKEWVVAIRCQGTPQDLKVESDEVTSADYARHVSKIRERLPGKDFSIVVERPFVVVGDGGQDQVRRTAEKTVRWAVKHIKQDFFKKDPDRILTIWLFKDAKSYRQHNVELFGKEPTTPYGYYSSVDDALVMDISTGGGTLVHEIVHPFIESNFPNCPSWFNEGLASLYEQSSSRDGKIVGLTNWRLRGLQLAIADDRLGSFEALCKTTTREFYQGSGNNYAQARYLCYYLQERGLLRTFYHQFVADVSEDPGGYQTLQRVLDNPDMDEFEKTWREYVKGLKF